MKGSLRILLVEDSHEDATLIASTLSAHNVRTVDNRTAFISALDERWDLIISDFLMPSFTALDVLNELQLRHILTPVIVMTAAFGKEAEGATRKLGASGYLQKNAIDRLLDVIAAL